jgi:hypothetical protein
MAATRSQLSKLTIKSNASHIKRAQSSLDFLFFHLIQTSMFDGLLQQSNSI